MGNESSIGESSITHYVKDLAECMYRKCNVKKGVTEEMLYNDVFKRLTTDKLDLIVKYDDELSLKCEKNHKLYKYGSSEIFCNICPPGPENMISIKLDRYKSGSFGIVYTNVELVDSNNEKRKDCVVKICKKSCEDEMFVMLILYCLYPTYFPVIYLLYKDELYVDNFMTGTACVMEKLDIELIRYIDNHVNNPNEFIEILIKICENLEHLQGEIEFMHRDLHTGNIMLNKNGEPVFIDAGTFSLDLTKKGIPFTISNNSNDTISILEFNESYDLRIMFSEIYNKFIKTTTDKDGKEILSIIDQNHPFAQYLTQIFKPYPPKTRNYFYRVHSDDPNFYPENMKSELKKILDQASENPAKKSRKTKKI